MLTHTLIISVAALIGLAIVTAATLLGWNGWLTLRNREMEFHQRLGPDHGPHLNIATCNYSLARIEMADLRERVRKLEDIAAGIDV